MIGPGEKTNEITELEEFDIIEAYQEAQEYLETGFQAEDFYFDPEE